MYTMKFIINDNEKIKLFVSLFQFLKNCSENITMIFYEEYIHLQGMDNSHVCLYDLRLTKEWFTEYENETNDCNTISFNSQHFYTIISSVNNDNHKIYINYEKENNDSLQIDLIVKENNTKSFSNYFKLNLIDLNYDVLQITENEYDVELTISTEELINITSKMILFDGCIVLRCNENEFNIMSNGSLCDMKVDIPIDKLTEYSICEGEEIEVVYSLSYMHKICLTNRLSKEVGIYIDKSSPMKIKYCLGNDSSLLYFLAPKIND